MVKAMQAPREAIRATNYYRSCFTLNATAAAVTGKSLFLDQASTDARNDLAGTGGRLPQGKAGVIQAMFFRLRSVPETQAAAQAAPEVIEGLRDLDAVLIVNGTEVSRVPLWACCHPPAWVQGMYTQTAAADGAMASVTNGGYMVQFTPHQVGQDQTIQVRIENPTNVALPAVGSGWKTGNTSVTNNTLDCEFALQVADSKLV